MSDQEGKSNFEKILTKGHVTAAYFSTSGHVENKDWHTLQPTLAANSTEMISRGDSGVFMESSDEDQDNDDQKPWQPCRDDDNKNQTVTSSTGQPELTEITLMQSQGKFGTDIVIHKSEEKLSVISEKSCEADSQRTLTSVMSNRTSQRTLTSVMSNRTPQRMLTSVMSNRTVNTAVSESLAKNKDKKQPVKKNSKPTVIDRTNREKSPPKKKIKKKVQLPFPPNRDINLDIPQLYKRQNTADLLHGRDKQIPVARSSVNRKISTVRNKMYGNSLRESTKKLQDDLRHTMRKYSTEKTQLLKQLSNLRHEMGDMKLSTSPSSSSYSEISSQRSQSRYYMAPNLAAHKIGKKKKKTQTQETKITSVLETSNKSKEGILKLPTINSHTPIKNFYPKTPPKNIEWDSGRNNYMHNLPPLHPPPGIAAAQDLLNDSFKIPKVQDSTRHDITRLSDRSNGKKKVHFAEKHSVTEFSRSGDTKSLPPLSSDTYSVDSIKAYSALPPIPWKNNDLDPDQVIRATQEYKNLYLKMKDPEQRMRTLSEILYSVRLRMIENEQTLKYGINPKHMKSANTLCDFLMNRNHYSSMSMNSMNSDMASDIRGKQGIPHNTAARSGRKSSSLQLQSYLRKMSRSRRPSEDIRLSRMMGQQNAILETPDQSTSQTVSN